jgi:hypothetical protein
VREEVDMKRVVVVCTSLWLAVVTAACAADEDPASELGFEAGKSSLDHEESLASDALVYAGDQGVSHEEAIARLDAQARVGRALADLERENRDRFAGVRWNHDPFYVEVLSTRPIPDVAARLERAGVQDVELRSRTVRWTIAELDARLRDRAALLGGDLTGGFVDVGANEIVLEVKPGAAEEAMDRLTATLADGLDGIRVEERESMPTYGGLHAPGACTTGFSMYRTEGYPTSDPVHYFTMAAHCPDQVMIETMGTADVIHSYQWWVGRRDYQAMYIPDVQAGGYFWDGSAWRVRSGVRDWSAINDGDFFCKYGMTSGYSCGFVLTKHRLGAPGHVLNEQLYVEVGGAPSQHSLGGDSGGPWFVGGDAMGLMQGAVGPNEYGTNNAIIMSISWPLQDGWGLL